MTEGKKGKETKNEFTKVDTIPIPYSLNEVQENIHINQNTLSQQSKEQIINQAYNFHSQGNFLEASKYYQYFINKGFKDPNVFCNYGVILKKLGKFKLSEISLRKAIELKPDLAEAHYNLGNILQDLGKSKEAEISLKKAISYKPNYANAHHNIGNILKDLGKL